MARPYKVTLPKNLLLGGKELLMIPLLLAGTLTLMSRLISEASPENGI